MITVKFTWHKMAIEFAYTGNPEDKRSVILTAEREGLLAKTARQQERAQFFALFTLALSGIDGAAPVGSLIKAGGKLSANLDGKAVVYSLPVKLFAQEASAAQKRLALGRALERIEKQVEPLRQELAGLAS